MIVHAMCNFFHESESSKYINPKHKKPVLETWSVLVSSVLQSPSELVPKSLKVQNAAAAKLLVNWGSMASPVLNI